jgi:hypothetical protein
MCDDKETNQLIKTVKELFTKNINNKNELSKLIDEYLIPKELEKKTNAEVSTPYELRQEMLDKIPSKFWTKKRKVFEPCSGKGGFVIDIIDRFMEGLKDKYKDEKERYQVIVEECLYFSDINATNIFVCKLLIDPNEEYEINYNEGNTLELDINEKWGIEGFDAVISNPPYQAPRKKENKTKGGGGDLLWNKFVKISINDWLVNNGYLCYVHPAGWRKPCGLYDTRNKFEGLLDLMTKDNYMKYLNINDTKEGIKQFNCGTRFDWYIIKKTKTIEKTIINDENNKIIELNLFDVPFIPNSNIKLVLNKISNNIDDNIKVLRPGSDIRRDYISNEKSDEYNNILIHSTPLSGVRYKYSNIKKESDHFGIKKIIFGETGINDNIVLDKNGKYGITSSSFGFIVNKNFQKIKEYMLGDEFSKIIKSCNWSNYRIDWRLFTYFKKDFWKGFTEE